MISPKERLDWVTWPEDWPESLDDMSDAQRSIFSVLFRVDASIRSDMAALRYLLQYRWQWSSINQLEGDDRKMAMHIRSDTLGMISRRIEMIRALRFIKSGSMESLSRVVKIG